MGHPVQHAIAEKAAAGLGPQLLTVSDGYGLPILFASLFVYILMRLLVKPFLVDYLAKKGLNKKQREGWILRSTFLPGLLAAAVVDFTPIAKAVGVPLHWLASGAVGAVFYAAGGVAMHELLKRVDPIGKIAALWGGKTDEEHKAEAEEIFVETTTRAQKAITIEEIEADKLDRGL